MQVPAGFYTIPGNENKAGMKGVVRKLTMT
jgi:hypothetical protein